MDNVISIEEVTGLLKNPPSLAPRPNFFRLRAIRRHIVNVLKNLQHPWYPIHGWTGMAMQPGLFALLDPLPFVMPGDPGAYPTYTQFASTSQIRMIDSDFKVRKNMYLTSTNIARAIFLMLTDCVPEQYRVSNTPGLSGWNQTMSINEILDQLESTYGRPDATALLQNDALYRSSLSNTEAPESLFLRLELCQEVQILANNPYTDAQMLHQAVLLLRQSNILPTKDFDDWEDVAIKSWPIMKLFFHKRYTKRLTAISMNATSGQHGYTTGNQYGLFNMVQDADDSTSTDGTSHTAAAATTMVPPPPISTMGQTFATNTSPELTNAIAQLVANQNSMMSQMAALSFAPTPPPVPHVIVPTQQTFTGRGGRNAAGGSRGGRGGRGRGRGYRGRPSFADATQHGAYVPPTVPLFGGNIQQPGTRRPPNPIKRFNNWNYCYSCGFDVEDGHTSQTCPPAWRKVGHQVGCTRDNVQQYLTAGHTPRMSGQHKTQLPQAEF